MGRVCVSHTESSADLQKMLDLCPTAIQISYPHRFPTDRKVQIIRVIQPGMLIPPAGDTDALIVDASQGRGRAYDPGFVREIMGKTSLPVILAGGLHPGNVAEAVSDIHPYAVDVASGIENAPGIKDPAKVRAFVQNARLLQ